MGCIFWGSSPSLNYFSNKKQNRRCLFCFVGAVGGTLPASAEAAGFGSDSPQDCHSLPNPFKSPILTHKKTEQTMSVLFLLVRSGGRCPLLRRRRGSALTVHRTVIHSRTRSSPPFLLIKKQNRRCLFCFYWCGRGDVARFCGGGGVRL